MSKGLGSREVDLGFHESTPVAECFVFQGPDAGIRHRHLKSCSDDPIVAEERLYHWSGH